MPKAFKSDARNIILKGKSFFEEEAREQCPIIPFKQIYKRIPAATGVSEGLISKIAKEGKVSEETSTKLSTPGKNRERKSDFINVDDFDQGVIRRKNHKFYSIKKELPNIGKLLNTLKEDIGFEGFRFKKTQSYRKVLIERNDVSALRVKYLHEIIKNNRSQGRTYTLHIHWESVGKEMVLRECCNLPLKNTDVL